MGSQTRPSINEAVFLLSKLDADRLTSLQSKYPELGDELFVGRDGGEPEPTPELNLLRAKIMLDALKAAKARADKEIVSLRLNIASATKWRLRSQIATLVLSSGVLAALAIGSIPASAVSGSLSLMASIGVMLAEQKEKLLKGKENIYDVYESVHQLAYRAERKISIFQFLLEHKVYDDELEVTIKESNQLCEDINIWLGKIL